MARIVIMKPIPLQEIKPGMVFDSPVFIDPNNLFVRANEPIKSSDIERLLKWGIREVLTEGKVVETKKEVQVEGPVNVVKSRAVDLTSMRLHAEYENLRKYWSTMRNDLVTTGDVLQINLKSLVDKKIFNNHELIEMSQKIVSHLFEVPFSLLALQDLIISDQPLIHHSVRAAAFGAYMAKAMNLSKPRVQELFFGILVMDVGMFLVPESIRRSHTAPDPEEWKSLKSHPLTGYKVLVNHAYVKTSLAVISLQHHENYDGSGYPRQLRENQIDLLARIAAISDRFTALLEDRYHRAGMLPYDAMRVLLGTEAGRFDPIILRAFLGAVSIYPTGSIVQLSTDELGLVLGCSSDKPLRPLVRILRQPNGKPNEALEFVDLNEKPQLYIVKALTAAESGIKLVDEI